MPGADVERRRTGGPVSGTFVAADRPPREGRTFDAELARALPRQVEGRVAPPQRIGGRVRRRIGQHREDEALRVPEGVAVVAGPGQALGRDRALFRARSGLEGVEQRKANSLLELRVAVELDVGAIPEVVEILTLQGDEAVPTGVARLRERRDDEIANGRKRSLARPAVGDELDDPYSLPDTDVGGNRHSTHFRRALGARDRSFGAFDDVIHSCRDAQSTALRRVNEHDSRVVVRELLRVERRLERSCGTRVGRLRGRRLVRDQLGLDDDPQRAVHRLDLVEDGRNRPLNERDEPGRPHTDRCAGR